MDNISKSVSNAFFKSKNTPIIISPESSKDVILSTRCYSSVLSGVIFPDS